LADALGAAPTQKPYSIQGKSTVLWVNLYLLSGLFWAEVILRRHGDKLRLYPITLFLWLPNIAIALAGLAIKRCKKTTRSPNTLEK
jgi:hypothetical protein